jgi:hypothetical protein
MVSHGVIPGFSERFGAMRRYRCGFKAAVACCRCLSPHYSGKGQQAKIGYMATAVVFSFCTLTAEIFFMVKNSFRSTCF